MEGIYNIPCSSCVHIVTTENWVNQICGQDLLVVGTGRFSNALHSHGTITP